MILFLQSSITIIKAILLSALNNYPTEEKIIVALNALINLEDVHLA